MAAHSAALPPPPPPPPRALPRPPAGARPCPEAGPARPTPPPDPASSPPQGRAAAAAAQAGARVPPRRRRRRAEGLRRTRPGARAGGLVASLRMAAGGRAAPEPPPPPGGPGAGAEVFAYTPADFVRQGAAWAGGGGAPSPFDVALQRGWADRVARGLFRYRLGELRTRLLPGPAGFVAQLNPRRGWDRRPPQEARSVRQPFDPRRFNFTRLRPGEVLFALAPRHRPRGPPPVLVAINVSPLEQGHVLLLPEPGRGLPQVLTAEALLAGLEALLLSGRAAFRLGFNSLGAGASVNHLHLHAYYLARELRVETAPCRPLRPAAGLHLLHGVPAPGLLFYCPAGGDGLEQLARRVCRLTDHLARHEVAHNLFATRGAAPEGERRRGAAAAGARPGVRVILWPRRVSFGAKDGAAFNVALCELAGHLPLKTAADFEALTEDSARRLIQAQLLPDDRFAQLQRELVALLEG
uniref:LOW QUALITY PROTEIN: GDP-D-glucose phosphorylase 1 n=1 Tax=Euleptes europaea TaxID=460621 RepID=UPI0025402885|nr:LOW QUALITY PROTEIN: GDP-D-glucose phosphorylase 1 [Euleptes europaea]